ncbi:LuxR C-terminal-related transcriptional regulator [Actinoplanes sp. NPDC020271]|uniref:helix-turn-helix transcriptional regulator n=1 Tax=Actinoplanes sp. NPDC020271 TaxID=3363896 RepID=UPI0037A35CC1
MTDSDRRALAVATALLEAVGAGADWATACTVVAERLDAAARVYVEGVAAAGTGVWMPGDRDVLPEGRVVGDSQTGHGTLCAAGTGHHLALPVSTTSVLVVCRPRRRFTAAERQTAQLLLPLLRSIQRHVGLESRPMLTSREMAVLRATADGLTATAASRRLEISARTFEKHLERIYRKMGTRGRVQTVLLAQKLGILSVSAARSAAGPQSGVAAAT